MSVLNGVQSREINRANTLSAFFDDNVDICSLLNAFATEVTSFNFNIQTIDSLIPVKKENGEGITETKNDLKASIANNVNTICALSMAYAVAIGNKEYQNSLNYSAADIMKLKDSEVHGVVISITNLLSPLLNEPNFQAYSITQEMLDGLNGDAGGFNNILGRAAIADSNSSIADKNINLYLKSIKGNIAQFDRMIHFFRKDYPNFVSGYHKSATINDSGIRHNTVEGTITNKATGAPIEGATVTGTNKKKRAVSDDKGIYRLDGIRVGEHALEVKAPGFSAQSLDVKIARGKVLQLNISL